jgi:hypothetical protein
VGPYGPGGFGYAPVLPSVQNQAVASLVLGILGVVPCCWPFNAVLGLVGLPLGVAALLRINRGQARDDGKGVAIAGIVISSLAILAAIVILVLVFATETTQYGLIEPGVGG